ncbi:MAG: hypothetical protein EPO10_13880 [Reyranella sp.]|uniref:hypothetical protein n=1 Tax=Reyranella sp. TaxID=1929291 RepID=UPI001203F635|nr:hypothetical protein [Reyranella sp.]TAJ90212.1 MAG: hypothetical protein EPO41_18285 [Reyranella sp.]TBR28267.1 MAG: hypothetical protein EPO10_13880 [Reyranella sp.]
MRMIQFGGLVLVALLAAACTQTAGGPPPGMTAAQAAAYCTKLSWAYGEYVASGMGDSAGDNDNTDADINARLAIAQCHEGQTGAAIPVLQQELRRNKVPVPPV